jgi:hypothetical protein
MRKEILTLSKVVIQRHENAKNRNFSWIHLLTYVIERRNHCTVKRKRYSASCYYVSVFVPIFSSAVRNEDFYLPTLSQSNEWKEQKLRSSLSSFSLSLSLSLTLMRQKMCVYKQKYTEETTLSYPSLHVSNYFLHFS